MSKQSPAQSPAGFGNPIGTLGIGIFSGGLLAALGAPDLTGNAIGLMATLNAASGMSITGGGGVGGSNATPAVAANSTTGVPSGTNPNSSGQVCMTMDQMAKNRGAGMPGGANGYGSGSEGSGGSGGFCLQCIMGQWVRVFIP